MTIQDFLNHKIKEIFGENPYRDDPPTSEDPAKLAVHYQLEWREPSKGNLYKNVGDSIGLADARQYIADSIEQYLGEDTTDILLIRAQAGIGKSYQATKTAQRLAREGKRVLYLMPRHAYWDDIRSFPHFDFKLWYHWRPVSGEDMCRYANQAGAWMRKGYPLINLCKAVCADDGHIARCAYRKQSRMPQPIIAGVHNHAVSGLASSDFDVVIIDELPLSAFVSERTVPARFIDVGGRYEFEYLTEALTQISISAEAGQRIGGKELMDVIGEYLRRLYRRFDFNEDFEPYMPDIADPDDAYTVKEFYVWDLLRLLQPEFAAWDEGWPDWTPRVFVTRDGVTMLDKQEPWEKLPYKTIILDATGSIPIYEQLFGRRVRNVRPNVKRAGRLYQITERYYGQSDLLTGRAGDFERAVKPTADKLIEVINAIKISKPTANGHEAYRNVAAITYKDFEPYLEAILGEGKVLHFGGSRGSNVFVRDNPIDCLIIAGCPSPPERALIDATAQLNYRDELNPSTLLRANMGEIRRNAQKTARSMRQIEYNYINTDGLSPYRWIPGYWEDDNIQLILDMYREAELVQSIHRARIITNPCDVWLLTSVPVGEIMDGVYQYASDILEV